MHHHNKGLAANVARAERELTEANKLWVSAKAEAEKVEQRIGKLNAERAEIIARRLAGNADSDSAERLVVIDADLEGLRGLLEPAREKAQKLEPTSQLDALNFARQQWEDHQHQVEFDALAEQVQRAEGLFLAAIEKLHTSGQRLGKRQLSQSYRPGLALRTLVENGVLPRR